MAKKVAPDAYHHGDLRRALVVEALALLDERGLEAVSLRELARRLGVSYGAPHHHFAEKDDLLAALATEAFERLETSIAERLGQVDDPEPATVLRAVGKAYLDFATKNPALYEVMFLPQLRDRVRFAALHETGGRSLERLANLFAYAETLEPGRARARAVACWSALHGYAVLANAGFLDDERSTGRRAATIDALLDSVVVVRPRS